MNLSFDVDEDNNGDPYDDDEALSVVTVIIGYNLGDYVWHDIDGDGIQDNNEQGIEGVFVVFPAFAVRPSLLIRCICLTSIS